ncbi:hypothetical protein JCM3770_002701 [Rhodotorula araucariae]
MSHFYAQQPRPRPEPIALAPQHHHTSTASSEHRARLLSSLRSAPLPQQHHMQNFPQSPQQQQQQYLHQQGAYAPGPSPQVQAIAEFQHAQSAYLAELQRTIESQIVAQQQLEREAAYRMLVAQGQGRGSGSGVVPPHVANSQYAQYAPAPHQQQGLYSAGPAPNRGGPAAFAQQQQQRNVSPVSQQSANNPLVASALARRQRQEQVQASQQQHPQRGRGSPSPAGREPRPAQQQQQPRSGARENRSMLPPAHAKRMSPPPPAVILSAPGEPYPDMSSSGSESGDTRPSSPDTGGLDATGVKKTKSARRRSHLDALAGLGHAVEQRKGAGGRARPVSVGFAGDAFARPVTTAYDSNSANPILSPHATSYTPLPSPAPAPHTVRQGPPPVPGTASAVRQPRGPPTELSDAANFATRVRARAIESLRGARGCSSGASPAPAPASALAPTATAQASA